MITLDWYLPSIRKTHCLTCDQASLFSRRKKGTLNRRLTRQFRFKYTSESVSLKQMNRVIRPLRTPEKKVGEGVRPDSQNPYPIYE